MARLRKAATLAAVTGLLLACTGGGVATANVALNTNEAFVVSGSGTINPGLPSCFPNVTFAGTMEIAGDVSGFVEFDGASTTCETELNGQGNGNVNGLVAGAITYRRTGAVVTLTGNVVLNGATYAVLDTSCLFTPTNVNPITAFELTCGGDLAR